jgi:hypothetical protein
VKEEIKEEEDEFGVIKEFKHPGMDLKSSFIEYPESNASSDDWPDDNNDNEDDFTDDKNTLNDSKEPPTKKAKKITKPKAKSASSLPSTTSPNEINKTLKYKYRDLRGKPACKFLNLI